MALIAKNKKGCDIGYALAANSYEEVSSVEARLCGE